MTALLQTTYLGQVQGKNIDGVTHYRGIKYASLRNRLADAELITSRSPNNGILDATKYGPTAASPVNGCDLEQSFVQKALPKQELPQSDTECLNLNIAVPEGTTSTSKLPVLLFIHGGGLHIGANSWPQFDWTRVIKLSVEKGVPILAVGPNYRLGAFGFMTSEELRAAGYKANNGFRDQRTAIAWVHRHIRDFGGDPDNITLAGMSAGGGSTTQHLHSTTPLCKRALSMSGTNILMYPLPYVLHERNYETAIKAWGLDKLSPEDRVKAIIESPAAELVAKLPPSVAPSFAVDGDLIPNPPTFAQISDKSTASYPVGKSWCKEILIGDAQHDSSILGQTLGFQAKNAASRFIGALTSVLSAYPAEISSQILDSYGISSTTPDKDAFDRILEFLNDILFHAPVLAYAAGWPEDGNAYVYYFNEENPFEGPSKGRATHILDLAYFYQNYNDYLTPQQQEVARAFAEDLIRFVAGQAPWEPCKDLGEGFRARIFGPSDKQQVRRVVKDAYGGESQRRDVIPRLAREQGVHLDALAGVFPAFLSSFSP
ncbi:carboxylesterase, putative [Talaromyces stipitatus ATCC 10500]|uniref:Carboxylic ester hydrolase n=1 Tax=Talaromyces stipitatus (strain ATCC 10500 / CBS 375.48 / QM 6759 / NRRL 1006) TaxID=441959 RepID=B8MRL2_TALSN|nr:carboxylesterase, putative [Talaromyces stipitatus ATCC 10500]EED13169.1 carboxylesterase, putative [Talaromyces stipitatus ATCC 10500]